MNRVQPDTTITRAPRIIQYVSNLSQEGTAAPTENILLNQDEITITWERTGAGQYNGVIPLELIPGEDLRTSTTITCQQSDPNTMVTVELTAEVFYIYTKAGGTLVDDALYNSALEIKIYT